MEIRSLGQELLHKFGLAPSDSILCPSFLPRSDLDEPDYPSRILEPSGEARGGSARLFNGHRHADLTLKHGWGPETSFSCSQREPFPPPTPF